MRIKNVRNKRHLLFFSSLQSIPVYCYILQYSSVFQSFVYVYFLLLLFTAQMKRNTLICALLQEYSKSIDIRLQVYLVLLIRMPRLKTNNAMR
jgi:hypothetical protein